MTSLTEKFIEHKIVDYTMTNIQNIRFTKSMSTVPMSNLYGDRKYLGLAIERFNFSKG
jgi:hypothetical protein